MASIQVRNSTLRQRQNHYIHSCFIRNDYRNCLQAIEAQLHACNGQSEYPLYIKGLIMRQQGRIEESLTIFQAALCLNPVNLNNFKQVAQSLYLLGKHREALEVFDEAAKLCASGNANGNGTSTEDRMIWHSKGMCFTFLRQFDEAIACFETANKIQPREQTYMELGELYRQQGRLEEALNTFLDGIEVFSQSPQLLSCAGLLQLQLNNSTEAFLHLGNALTYDPRLPAAILGAGSIIQTNADYDVALTKYRVAMAQMPHSAELWNNVGLCFLAKGKLVGAAASLKRAAYLAPFDARICFNLGLCHMHLQQPASAFHYFSAGINLYAQQSEKFKLSPKSSASKNATIAEARCYAFMAVALGQLEDYENSFAAYRRALDLRPGDSTVHVNYCVTLAKAWQAKVNASDSTALAAKEAALAQLGAYEKCLAAPLKGDENAIDTAEADDARQQYMMLRRLLRG